ncbi:MAG: hypothetical protein CMB80_20250 [Flammeovirgaceae bacterium]|nr:hypothetical protein [Flammeovirgaceae bacterium]HCX21072.1 hypothetical protein [Cytophagales bacterium]
MRIRVAIISLLFVAMGTVLYGQTNFYSKNTVVKVEENAKLYVSGNYTDASQGSDVYIFLQGTLSLGGNFTNNGSLYAIDSTKTTENEYGTLEMIGANKTISGRETFIPGLKINNSSSNVTASNNLAIQKSIDLTGGSFTLNNDTIEFGPTTEDAILNETSTRAIKGIGVIDFYDYKELPSTTNDTNFKGTGLGLKLDALSTMASVKISRIHTTSSKFTVTDGVHSKRYYTFEVPSSTSGDIKIPTLHFNSFANERTGISTPLSIYVSDTTTEKAWIKLNTSNPTTNRYSTSNFQIKSGKTYELVLAKEECSSVPDTNPDISTGSFSGSDIRVCYNETLTITSNAFFSKITYDGKDSIGYNSNTFTISSVTEDDEGSIILYERFQNGCENTREFQLDVIPLPDVGFTWSPGNQYACFDKPIQFTDTTKTPQSTIQSYLWEFNDGNTSTAENPQYTFLSAGNHFVDLTVTDTDLCVNSTTEHIQVQFLPIPNFSFADGQDDIVCENEPFTIENYSQVVDIEVGSDPANPSLLSVIWSFDDPDLDQETEFDLEGYHFDTLGVKTIYIVIKDSVTRCKNYDTLTMRANPLPTVDFHFEEGNDGTVIDTLVGVCEGNIRLMNDSFVRLWTDDYISLSDWKVDGVSISDSVATRHSFQEGLYGVRLIQETNHGCVDSTDHEITIHPQPSTDPLNVTRDGVSLNTACIDDNLLFESNLTIPGNTPITYSWDFGDGGSSNLADVNHSYSASGNYTIELTATSDKDCEVNIRYPQQLIIREDPVAGFTYNEVCEGEEVNLEGDENDDVSLSYAWTISDGTSEISKSGQSVSYTFADGELSNPVKLKVTDDAGCQDSITSNVIVHRASDISLSADLYAFNQLIYSPVRTGVFPIQGEATFSWRHGGSEVSNNDTLKASESGNYFFHVTPNDGYCGDTLRTFVTIIEPRANFSDQNVGCESAPISARPTTIPPDGTFSYKWYKGSNPAVWSTLEEITVTESDWYKVEITYTNGSSITYTDSVDVTISDSFTVDLGEDQTICSGTSTRLQSNVLGATYIWIFKGDTIPASTSYLDVTESGIYTLYAESANCYDRDEVEVLVVPSSESVFEADKTFICEGESIQFTNLTAAADGDSLASYHWSFGDGANSTDRNEIHQYLDSGVYTVQLSVTSKAGCTTSSQQTITVNPVPVPDFSVGVFCANQDIELTNLTIIEGSVPMTYSWEFGDTNPSDEANPQHSYATGGSYDITLTVTTISGCSASVTHSVEIDSKPAGNIVYKNFDNETITQGCIDQDIYFNHTFTDPTSLTYSWDFGDGDSSTDTYPIHSFSAPGSYPIVLEVTTNEGCTYLFQRNLTIYPEVDVDFDFANVCDGEAVQFINNSEISSTRIDTYFWDFGDGETSTGTNPTHTYSAYGTYTVILTAVSNRGCESSISKSVEVYRKPEFDLGNYALSVTGSYLLDPTSDPSTFIPSGSTYEWSKGGELSTDPTYEAFTYGNYTLTVQSPTPELCETSSSIQLYILNPNEFPEELTVCSNYELEARPLSIPPNSSISYLWYKDDTYQNITSSKLTVSESGTYRVDVTFTVTNQPGNPSMTYSQEIDISFEDPTAAINLGGPLEICNEGSLTLTSNVLAETYQWTNLSTGVVLGTEMTQEVFSTGLYQLEITSGACNSIGTVNVIEAPTPVAGFISDAAYCIGSTVSFEDISFSDNIDNDIVSYEWAFGDGNSSTLQNPDNTYTVAGVYDVSLTVTSENGCSNTFTKQLTIQSEPLPSFTASTECVGTATVFSDASTYSGEVEYLWDFGDGNYSTQEEPTHTYAESGIFDVTLTLSNQCEVSFTDQVEVLRPSTIFYGDEVLTCGSSIILDAGAGMTSYRWYDPTNDATLGTSQTYTETIDRSVGIEYTTSDGCNFSEEVDVLLNVAVVANLGGDRTECESAILSPGAFPGATFLWSNGATTPTIEVTSSGTYSVDVTDQNGCIANDEVVITIVSPPTLELGPDKLLCFGEEVILDVGNAGASYVWSNGSTSQTITVTEAGTYTVEVSNGSCTSVDSVKVSYRSDPSVAFSYTGSCSGSSTSFTYTGAESEISNYFWEFGDGTSSSKATPQKTFASHGNYDVTLTITNSNGCEASITQQIDITPGISPDFSFSNACEGNEIEFTDLTSYSGGDALSYQWVFGDGGSSTEASPSYTYASEGNYTIVLTVSNEFSCEESNSQGIVVKSSPVFDMDNVATCDESVLLEPEITGNAYLWSDGSTSSTLLVETSGQYTLKLTDAYGCYVVDTVEVDLLETDVPNLGEDIESCGEVTLDPAVVTTIYQWSTGETSNTIDITESGTYWVKTVSSDLCTATDTISVAINPLPEFELGSDQEFCAGDSAILKPTSSVAIQSYVWNDGSTASTLVAKKSGLYKVTLTSEEGCDYVDSLEIVVNEMPDLVLDESYVACERLTLDAANEGSSYVWSNGDFSSSIEVTQSGTYWVQITNSSGCSLIDSTNVTITTTPVVSLGFDQEICEGDIVILDAENAGANYLWSTGATTRTIDVDEAGEYYVEVSYGGCSDYDTILVDVNSAPSIDFEFGLSCSGVATSFEYTGGESNLTYLWDFGDGTKSTSGSPSKIFSTSGAYLVSLTVTSASGCSSTISKEVDVSPRIQPGFAFTSVCSGHEVIFTNGTSYAGSDSLTYTWYFGEGSQSSLLNPTHTYDNPGSYVVTLDVANSEGCLESLSKIIEIKAAPVVDIGDEIISCAESITINAGNSGSTYRWSDNSKEQRLTVSTSGVYYVDVTNSNGCVTRDSVNVIIYEYDRVNLGEDMEACGSALLDPNAQAFVYEWSTGERTQTINPSTTGTYWVRTVSDDGCSSSDTINVLIDPLPVFDLGADVEVCDGAEVTLTASSDINVVAYEWNTGSTDNSIVVTETGSYSATLLSDEGCEYSDEIFVDVNQIPIPPLDDSYIACESIRLLANNTGNGIFWSNGSSLPYMDVTQTGEYWVEIVTPAGCSITDTTYVEVIPLPQPDLGPDIEICFGEEVTLDAGVYSAYKWDGIAGGRYLTVGQSGRYKVTVTNEYGCEQTDEIRVVVRSELGLELPDERLVCEGSEFTLDAGIEGEGYTYEWSSESGLTGDQQLLEATEPGLYWVKVTDSFGCSQMEVVNIITTTESIEASFLMPSVVNVSERVNFVQLTDPLPESYLWEFGDGFSTKTRFNPTKYYYVAGEYEVSLTVSNGICEHKVTKTLIVNEGRSADLGDDKIGFIQINNFKVYPNPSSDYVTFDFELSNVAIADLQIYDLSGYLMNRHVMEEESGELQLDITNYASGTYVAIFKAGKSIKKLRFVKMK